MAELSSNLLYAAFLLYLVATFIFGGAIRDNNSTNGYNRWSQIGIIITTLGFAAHLGYFITRWIAAGHAPVSNLFEFITAFGMMLVLAFIIIYFIYKSSILGLFTLPIALIIIAYGSMFSSEISPLIPALQSDWLHIHVITAALGQAILAISFVAGILYLLKAVDQSVRSKETIWLEFVMYVLVVVVGFVVISSTFGAMKYESAFSWVDKEGVEAEMVFTLPALVVPNEGELLTDGKFSSGIELPAILSARKVNTVLWSIIVGTILYGLLRLILRKRIGAALQPLTKRLNLDLTDEIGYRSVAIGFPVFTLGALIFAMIWAQIAWTRFWGWDPKEVWALITWLFYAAFL